MLLSICFLGAGLKPSSPLRINATDERSETLLAVRVFSLPSD